MSSEANSFFFRRPIRSLLGLYSFPLLYENEEGCKLGERKRKRRKKKKGEKKESSILFRMFYSCLLGTNEGKKSVDGIFIFFLCIPFIYFTLFSFIFFPPFTQYSQGDLERNEGSKWKKLRKKEKKNEGGSRWISDLVPKFT